MIQLYAAGHSGNASAAAPVLTSAVLSDSGGSFSLTGLYTCGNADDQMYLTATGGNPGLGAGGNNAALLLVAALGRCGDLSSSTYISLNELTTAAAAWALAPFATSATQIGASASNSVGLTNAFVNSHLIVDPGTGQPPALAPTQHLETGKVLALADALSTCVNSDGGVGCNPLLSAATPPGGSAPTDTFSAALNIVKNPGNNVAAVWNTITPQAPYPTTLTHAPADWTLSLSVSGSGIVAPTGLALDTLGNVWTTSFYGVLSGFSPQGTPLNSTGFGQDVLAESYGIAIDPTDNVWVSLQKKPSHYPTKGGLVKFLGASSGSSAGTVVQNSGSNYFFDGSMNYPTGIFADSNGNILITNNGNSTAEVYDSNGQPVATSLALGTLSFPTSVAADGSHGMWIANEGDTTLTHLAPDGTILATPSCCLGADAVALDPQGNVWAANFYGSSVSEVSPSGAVLIDEATGGGLTSPTGIAVDAAGTVWVANYHGGSLSEVAGYAAATPGTALSPANGFGTDIPLMQPYSVAPDRSGNLWVSDFAGNDVVMFFGLATPTLTPLQPLATAP